MRRLVGRPIVVRSKLLMLWWSLLPVVGEKTRSCSDNGCIESTWCWCVWRETMNDTLEEEEELAPGLLVLRI